MEYVSIDKAKQLSLLSLALLGDGVWSLYVRERLIISHDYNSGVLSKMARDYVNAVSQSIMLNQIMDSLNQEESDIARRARNTHNISRAKNATVIEYKKATALEALFGYLHISGQKERLGNLMNTCYVVGTSIIEQQKNDKK